MSRNEATPLTTKEILWLDYEEELARDEEAQKVSGRVNRSQTKVPFVSMVCNPNLGLRNKIHLYQPEQ